MLKNSKNLLIITLILLVNSCTDNATQIDNEVILETVSEKKIYYGSDELDYLPRPIRIDSDEILWKDVRSKSLYNFFIEMLSLEKDLFCGASVQLIPSNFFKATSAGPDLLFSETVRISLNVTSSGETGKVEIKYPENFENIASINSLTEKLKQITWNPGLLKREPVNVHLYYVVYWDVNAKEQKEWLF